MNKMLGKIKSVNFGLDGYQGLQFGLWLTLCSIKDNWEVCVSINAGWSYNMKRYESAEWSEESRDNCHVSMCKSITEILTDCKVNTIDQLVNIPVVVEFEKNIVKDWRILTEVI
jgi:hypothetical protein